MKTHDGTMPSRLLRRGLTGLIVTALAVGASGDWVQEAGASRRASAVSLDRPLPEPGVDDRKVAVEARIRSLIDLGYDLATGEHVPAQEVLDRVVALVAEHYSLEGATTVRPPEASSSHRFQDLFMDDDDPFEPAGERTSQGDFYFGPEDRGWRERPA